MQRLLLEGVRLLTDKWMSSARAGAQPEAVNDLPVEVYGHLALALRSEMVCATDERLKTLIAPRFAGVALIAFGLGDKSSQGMLARVQFCSACCMPSSLL